MFREPTTSSKTLKDVHGSPAGLPRADPDPYPSIPHPYRGTGLYPERMRTPPPELTSDPPWREPPKLIAGELNGEWLCITGLAKKRVDVKLEGLYTFDHRKMRTTPTIRALDGRTGYLLLVNPVTKSSLGNEKIKVWAVGKNSMAHGIPGPCIRPARQTDDGTPITQIVDRVVIIGPDVLGDASKIGFYAQTDPARTHSYGSAPVASLQSELKKDIADEFGGHIWQFSPKRISQMLSPKHLKSAYTKALVTSGQKGPLHPRLDDHICLVDDAVVASALDGIEIPPSTSKPVDRESQSYQTLCVFLNDCGQAINSAYDRLAQAHPSVGEFVLKPREKRWYPQLHFHPNDEATADGIDSAAPLKPDIVGLHEKDFDPKALPCCWGFSAAKNPQVRIPVEVKKAWPELIWQAGTYARALRSATPERALRLVFGYNQVTCDFRVLIFHNGGLAASLPCDLRSTSGRKDVVRMLWPVFLWQDAEDAGFPSFTDGDQLALCGERKYGLHRSSCVPPIAFSELQRPWHTLASFIGMQPQTCLDGGPRRTRASTQSKTQASRDRKVDQRDAKKTTTLGQKQSGSGGKKPASSELVKSRKPLSPQPSSPGSQQSPAPPISADIPQIRSVKYHEEAVAACVPTEFRTLGAAFAPVGDLETVQTPASRFHTAPDGPLNETAMASACSGLFGLPITQTWFQGCFKSGRPASSALFEPTENEKDTLHWAFSKDNKVSPNPDRRPLIVCVMEEEGMSLERCASAGDLCESILHALLGWLAAYERGWLQRDPSIGNILRLCQDRVQSWGADTKLKEDSEDLTKQLASIHLEPPISGTADTWDPKRASELEKALVIFGRPHICKAILTDFDLSAYLQDYFTAEHGDARSLSGTVEFITDLLPLSSQEITWRLHIRSRSADEREGTIRAIIKVQDFQTQFPPMLRAMAPVLKDWLSALDQMDDAWTARQYQASTTGGVGLPDFNHLAYSGVQDFIRIFTNHRERLAGAGHD
ncbi:hypothetical protein B0H14DRAFT_3864980 [Mycena olivaceomarginata]|nr:hypothetical protein B0H14DRAFT_3864980 [Mycena olivaceomarginata]